MKLIMWCSMANFFWMWCTSLLPVTCKAGFNTLLDVTTFELAGIWKATEAFVVLVPMQITFWYNILITLNTCLSWDLIKTLRNPFKKPESRYLNYYIYCLLFSAGPAACRALAYDLFLYGYIVDFIFLVYLTVSIWSIIFSLRYLFREEGMS